MTNPSPAPQADERALFEAYFAAALHKAYPFMPADCAPPKLWKHDNGDYIDLITQHDWKVWQARAALASRPQVTQGEPVYFVKSVIHPAGWHECSADDSKWRAAHGIETRVLYTDHLEGK